MKASRKRLGKGQTPNPKEASKKLLNGWIAPSLNILIFSSSLAFGYWGL
jgi:hypothetical protein